MLVQSQTVTLGNLTSRLYFPTTLHTHTHTHLNKCFVRASQMRDCITVAHVNEILGAIPVIVPKEEHRIRT